MALVFICDTCGGKFDAEVSGGSIIYYNVNERCSISNASDPCKNCKKEIDQAEEEAKQKIRERNKSI